MADDYLDETAAIGDAIDAANEEPESLHWEIDFFHSLIESLMKNIYDKGYLSGYNAGYETGYEKGCRYEKGRRASNTLFVSRFDKVKTRK